MSFLSIFSNIIGWVYFLAWSVSFYPQVWENYKLRNVNGLSIDYVSLNLTGYICLSAYSTAGYINPDLDMGEIHFEDLAFAYHGLFLTLIIIGQMIIYPIGDNKLSKIIIWILILLWTYTPIYILLTLVFGIFEPQQQFNAFKMMGYNKLFISLVKYVPQVWWNFVRKSTSGWNIWVSLLDLTGGLLSVLQTILDVISTEIHVQINWVKFLLGIITLVFDSILIVQHYILYPQKTRKKVESINYTEKSDLLGNE